jgi:HlyD family secretion protein
LAVGQRAYGGDIAVPLWSRERVVAIALGLVALLLAFLIAHDVLFPAGAATTSPRTVAAARGTVRSAVSGTGTVVPAAQQNLSFGVAGTLTESDVRVGDQVKQGQVLAKLDRTTFQTALDQANNNLTTAQATLNNTLNSNAVVQAQHGLANAQQSLSDAQAQVNLTNQQDANALAADQAQLAADEAKDNCNATPLPSTCTTLDQQTIAQDKSKITQDQNKIATDQLNGQKTINSATAAVTTAKDSLNSLTIQRPNTIASQQAAVANAQIAVQTAQKNLDQTTLTAPTDGTVLSINGQVGENASAGTGVTAQGPGTTAPLPSTSGSTSSGGGATSAASSFMALGNVSGLQVIAPFAEADAARLAANQTATITFDAVANLSVPAHVLAVASGATVISNVTNYYTTLVIDQLDPRLKTGMTANASVVVQQASNVLMLPNSAITRLGGLSFVNVLSKDGKTQTRQQVQTGAVGDQSTEIVSGLSAGDKVVLPQLKAPTTTGGGRGLGGGGGGGGTVRIGGGG